MSRYLAKFWRRVDSLLRGKVLMPALLISTSRRLNCFSMELAQANMEWSFVTSSWIAWTEPARPDKECQQRLVLFSGLLQLEGDDRSFASLPNS